MEHTVMADYFVHSQALCESQNIGTGTRIWAYSHILPEACIGSDCNICDQVFIENDVILGNRVTVKCGVQLWNGLRVEDDVFIGPNATFANDIFPRSKIHPQTYAQTWLRAGASVGANATILPGITIGSRAMVGAGAVVTRSVPPNAVVVGNPAKIVGYVDTVIQRQGISTDIPADQGVYESSVHGVTVHHLPEIEDMRGHLSAGELGRDVPFDVKRYFLVYDVPSIEIRGEHAHLQCQQFLIAVKGCVHVVADDGSNREEFVLDRPNVGLYIPPMVWGIQYRYSEDAALLVLASDHYNPKDYVRDYGDFLGMVKSKENLNAA